MAPTLDLSSWPPIFVSSTHFDIDDLHEVEEELAVAGAALTYDIKEAEIVLSNVVKKKRIQFDLRSKGLWTKDAASEDGELAAEWTPDEPPAKKQRLSKEDFDQHNETKAIVIDDSSTASEHEDVPRKTSNKKNSKPGFASRQIEYRKADPDKPQHIVKVLKTAWFTDSKRIGDPQPVDAYLTYRGIRIEQPSATSTPKRVSSIQSTSTVVATSKSTTPSKSTNLISASDIIERAKEDSPKTASKFDRFGRRKFGLNTPSANPSSWEAGHGTNSQYAHLLQQTTTDYEGGVSSDSPEMPEWVKQGVKYACLRPTPKSNPNDPFLDLMKEIKLARLLTNDEIGVRAYSTSIAAIAAYTYKISNPREILALPGCENKIANLWVEWKNTGKIKAVEDLEADEDLKVLRLFYNIWGVGATTAREFYYDKGWRDLDDIIEGGWKTLSRVQQIGVKYYDEFLDLIPRAEVEKIGETVHRHAVKVRDQGIQSMLVGGYRRGKEASGDVDIVVSHPDESATCNLVEDIVNSMEEEELITHTLLLSLKTTERDQQTLPFRAGGGGHGFGTADIASCLRRWLM